MKTDMKLFDKTCWNKLFSLFFLITICIHGFISASQAQNKRRTLNYEPETVTLTGLLVSRTFYGPPNYGENPKTDTKESQYILILDSPVNVIGDPNSPINRTEQGIKKVTLVVHDFKAHPVEPLLGSRIEVSGTLFHAQTGHHHTKVLIEVSSIRKIGKA